MSDMNEAISVAVGRATYDADPNVNGFLKKQVERIKVDRLVKIEVGPGRFPEAGYDYWCDLHNTQYANVLCHMEELPFDDGIASDLRAYEVLEHQSYTLLYPTLLEWYRVLAPGGLLHLKVPSARYHIERYMAGDCLMEQLNRDVMGGHTDQPVFRGYDKEKDTPRWLWNAHHVLLDWQMLKSALQFCGFKILSYQDTTHITVEAQK